MSQKTDDKMSAQTQPADSAAEDPIPDEEAIDPKADSTEEPNDQDQTPSKTDASAAK